jgi:hypothetical protein
MSSTGFSLDTVDSVKMGLAGLAEGACDDYGSVRKVVVTPKREIKYGTSAKAGGAKVKGKKHSPSCTVEITGEERTLARLAVAWDAAVNGTGLDLGAGMIGAATERVLYLRGMNVDDVPGVLKIHKTVCEDGGDLTLSVEPEDGLWVLKLEALWDNTQTAGQEFGAWTPTEADTTAPTFASMSPTDGATGVARSTSVDVTISEALRVDEIDAAHCFLVREDTHAVVACAAPAFYDAECKVIRLTPSATLPASTLIGVYITGVYDVAGNRLVAPIHKTFTTGS